MKKNVFSLEEKRDKEFSFEPLETTEQGMYLNEAELRAYIIKRTNVSPAIVEMVLTAEIEYLTKAGLIRVEE